MNHVMGKCVNRQKHGINIKTQAQQERPRRTVRKYAFRPVQPDDARRFAFKAPFNAIVVGMTGAGKTEWVTNYLNTYGLWQFHNVVVCAPDVSVSSAWDRLEKVWRDDLYGVVGLDIEALVALLNKFKEEKKKTCLILDDMTQESNNKFMQLLFTTSRHYTCSIFQMTHAIFSEGSRTNRLNSPIAILFDFCMKDEAGRYFAQITTNRMTRRALAEVYARILDRQDHGCLIIDQSAKSTRNLPLRVRDTVPHMLVPQLYKL